jgi:hypothetical protein
MQFHISFVLFFLKKEKKKHSNGRQIIKGGLVISRDRERSNDTYKYRRWGGWNRVV